MLLEIWFDVNLWIILQAQVVAYALMVCRQLFSSLWCILSAVGDADVNEAVNDDDLCKVCMDAVVDCILLECGHMVTCTNCGKRLAECPICRRYVSRVVHVFRAWVNTAEVVHMLTHPNNHPGHFFQDSQSGHFPRTRTGRLVSGPKLR